MKRIISISLLVSAAFLLQTSVFPRLPLGGISPNLLLILIVSFALIRGSRFGLWMGFASGMLLDLFFGSVLGIHAILYMYTGVLCGIFQKRFYPDDLKLPLFLTVLSDLLCSFLYYFFLFYLRGKQNFRFYLKSVILPECIFTIIVTIFVYLLILRFNNWLDAGKEQ